MTLVALLTAAGVIASVFAGIRLAHDNRAAWLDRGRQEAVDLTSSIDNALLQVEAQLRAIAILFYSSEKVEVGELAEAEVRLPADGLSVTLSGLAFATVVDDEERDAYELGSQTLLSLPGRPDMRSEEAYEHFPVTIASRGNSLFHRGADLSAEPALRAMSYSAIRLADTVVMSPAFRLDGRWLAGFAIAVPNDGETGLLVGVLELSDLFGHTIRWKPDGLDFRLMQHPSGWEPGEATKLVIGTSDIPESSVATFDFSFTHGEARWDVQWNLFPSYRGGADTVPAWLIAIAGSLLSIIIGFALGLLLYQNALIRRRVDERTAELREALGLAEQGSRSKTNFLAVIGHELRTPLNAVIGFSDLLEELQQDGTSRNYVQFVQAGGRHLLRLVNALLEVAQAETGELRLDESAVDLSELINETARSVGPTVQESTVALEINLPTDLPMVWGDRARLQLIIVNLFLNAMRAATDRGAVVVEAFVRDDDGGIRLVVSDTGPGMTESQVTASLRLFEQIEGPMSRRHEGLGIGLPLCRHLVHLHGGTLSIDTGPGTGTSVCIDLPAERTIVSGSLDAALRMQAP